MSAFRQLGRNCFTQINFTTMSTTTNKSSFKVGQETNARNFTFKPLSAGFTNCFLIFSMIVTLLMLALTSCGQNKLVNRWTAAGHYSNGKVEAEDNEGREYEFLKNGTLNIYNNGNVVSTATYTLAADSKTISVKEGRTTGSIKIKKLTASELIMIFSPGKDTIVFYPSGSAASKQSQAKAVSYYDLQSSWNKLLTQYQRRSDLISTLVNMVKPSTDANNEIFTRLSITRKEIQAFDVNLDKLTKEKFVQYENLQAKFSKDISDFFIFLKKYPSASQMSSDFAAMIPKIDSNIEKARADFVPSFNAYKGK